MDERKRFWKNLIFVVIVIVAVSVFYFIRGDSNVGYDLDGSSFVLHGPDGFTAAVDLSELRDAELQNGLDRGNAVSGGIRGNCAYGIWENSEFGRYRLCVLQTVEQNIILTERDGTVTVCNFESGKTTVDFYAALLKYAEENGYFKGFAP